MFHPAPRTGRWDPIVILAVMCFVGLFGVVSLLMK